MILQTKGSKNMTLEELRDLIDSTITENGNKAITGKALNLCMNELVQYVATNKPQTAERVYLTADPSAIPLTDEQKASNAAIYAKCIAAKEAGELMPILIGDLEVGTQWIVGFLSPITMGGQVPEGNIGVYFMQQEVFLLASDGSVTFMG